MKTNITLRKTIQWAMIIVLMAWASGFFAPAPASADIAPPAAPGLGGLEPFGYQDTEVQMVYERVEIEVEANTESLSTFFAAPDQAEIVSVSAWFVMRNQGSVDEKMQVIFPTSSFNDCSGEDSTSPVSYRMYEIIPETFAFSIDGVPVTSTQTIQTENPLFTNPERCIPMFWVGFDVTFPVGKNVLIRVDYKMITGRDALYIVGYILETGAAWNGPIEQAYIIFRTPYLVNSENIRSSTTPGYQMLYNEVYWSFRNFEPTHDDNIEIVFIAPKNWYQIAEYQSRTETDPTDVEAWLGLIRSYREIAYSHIYMPNDQGAIEKIDMLYYQALFANPHSAELHASNAQYLWYLSTDCWVADIGDDADAQQKCLDMIVPKLNAAFSLDSTNETAQELLQHIRDQFPDFTYTLPPTVSPTITPTPTQSLTPSITPTPLPTNSPTNTPRPTKTYTQRPTVMVKPTRTPHPTRTATVFTAINTSSLSPSSSPAVASPGATPTPSQPAATLPSWLAGFLLASLTFAAGIFVGRTFLPKHPNP